MRKFFLSIGIIVWNKGNFIGKKSLAIDSLHEAKLKKENAKLCGKDRRKKDWKNV